MRESGSEIKTFRGVESRLGNGEEQENDRRSVRLRFHEEGLWKLLGGVPLSALSR